MKTNPFADNFEPSRMYIYVRSRQLEGTFPGNPIIGTWISTSMRVGKGWGVVEESLWPYDGAANHWPPCEPPEVDLQAKRNRVLAYQRISTVDECRTVLATKNFIIAAFNIDDSWFKAKKGLISIPNNQNIIGAHTVSLVGYKDRKQMFTFVNSWGMSWGDGGHGYLPYNYFSNRFLEGWSIIALDENRPKHLELNGIHLYSWGINSLLGITLHGMEFIDSDQNEIIAWGFATEHKKLLNLEELFVRPNWRRQGYGSKLATEFNQLSTKLGKPLRAWIPHSDDESINHPALIATLHYLGLSLAPSPVKWASKIGI